MGREVLLAGLIQGRQARLLSADSHQGAVGAPGCEITLGLQGVINHQQHARIHGGRSSSEPVGQCTVPLRGPPLFGIGGRQLNAALAAHTPDLLVQTIGERPMRRLQATVLVELHPLLLEGSLPPDQALHREGIQQLMGDHHPMNRSAAQRVQGTPAQRQIIRLLQQSLLPPPHAGIGLHQHQFDPSQQLWISTTQRSNEIPGQMAFARADFHDRQALIRITSGHRRQPGQDLRSQKGCEITAQRGGGDEITLGSDACTA